MNNHIIADVKKKLLVFSRDRKTNIIQHSESVSSFFPIFKNGAVMFSGGVESTVLLYHHAIISDNPISISYIGDTKQEQVVSKLSKMISTRAGKAITNIFLLPEDKITINEIPDYAVQHLGVVGCLGGGNKPPEHLVSLPTAPIRFSDDCMKIGHLYRPFHNTTKDEVISIAERDGIMDIIKETRSCVSMVSDKCGECWFCVERKWAFELNHIND